jgi:glycosyltransferase involved in cell wall biosynthesis
MNVLLLNQNDPLRASGIIAMDLYYELKKRGYNVKLLVNTYSDKYNEDIICLETKFQVWKYKNITKRFKQKFEFINPFKTDPHYYFHELREKKYFFSTEKLLKKAGFTPDIIFVLFAKNFVNSRNIYEFYKLTGAKMFWIMYDMAPFTGGCHYAWDCKGYMNSCGNCPGLYSKNPDDVSHKNLMYKKKYISRTDINIIAGSEWQYRQARTSFLFNDKNIFKILLPFDKEIFKPVNKTEAKTNLGIPNDKKVIFFGAVYLMDERKGMFYLYQTLKILSETLKGLNADDVLLLVAGREIGSEELISFVNSLPFKSIFLNYLYKKEEMASVYQAADIYLCPSIEDSGPSMINQSILCGTPVVSFEMGVAIDLVINGETGYRARLKDSEDMASGLNTLLSASDEEYRRISENCRNLGLKHCTHEVQIAEFERILKDSTGKE